ncbi:hypothetical protein MRX96_044241 [Rhipicephalus microplus]
MPSRQSNELDNSYRDLRRGFPERGPACEVSNHRGTTTISTKGYGRDTEQTLRRWRRTSSGGHLQDYLRTCVCGVFPTMEKAEPQRNRAITRGFFTAQALDNGKTPAA